jgi:hypothetical protein
MSKGAGRGFAKERILTPNSRAGAGWGYPAVSITVLAKENPHQAGSRRAGWFKLLKEGMTVSQAAEFGVRSIYLTRMTARKVIKLY